MSDIRRREKHRDSRGKSKSSCNAQPIRRLLDGYSSKSTSGSTLSVMPLMFLLVRMTLAALWLV